MNYNTSSALLHLNKSTVKDAARGQWRTILSPLGVPLPNHGRHAPCPTCGGKDRFRFTDKHGNGEYYCNHCRGGDGLQLLQNYHGWRFQEAIQNVAELLNLEEETCQPFEFGKFDADKIAPSGNPQTPAPRHQEPAKPKRPPSNILQQWQMTRPASPDHTYLKIKRVQLCPGIRLSRNYRRLVVPMRCTENQLWGIQNISPNGKKTATKGSDKKGHFFPIKGQDDRALFIVEGLATGLSVHEATGFPVVVAFDANNLLPVAENIRAACPDLPLVIAADNDAWTDGNPGITAAMEAAEAVDGAIVWPEFEPGAETVAGRPTDFNDLQRLCGAEAVRDRIRELLPRGFVPGWIPIRGERVTEAASLAGGAA
ncbi:conserved hypothetical protein [Nitrosococcus oceani ATCC 19707]|uniref:Toprim domain-containing protein n=2 Tax=Nitrosococcus oceani TaxID=1229 RepID=Q3J8Z5_NITOC|nr:primase-helicase zinc-binding domain-containing protein [Nitrosococcus oceani]ABA58701.1 conserved hypothetical protein [Nitrosococcus oceani ATCC 19707]EDZ68012.1 Zinc-binding domain of primase-helicase family [Nitrosococcus oceani AFC27]KFI18778.1 DNA primase [Nitrosococcus oceani C-27]GEM19207.1 primase [Nitrosococcus oceani]